MRVPLLNQLHTLKDFFMFRVFHHVAYTVPLLLITLLLTACNDNNENPRSAFEADVRMTTYGVPHVKANDFASLGFGVAQVFLRENFCVLADQVVTVNGERSKYFGPAGNAIVSFVPVPNRDSDFFYKSYLDDAALASAYTRTTGEVRDLIRGYIAGYNEFVKTLGGSGARHQCKTQPWVRPIQEKDFLRLMGDKVILASGGAFARAIASAQPPLPNAPVALANAVQLAKPEKLDRDVVLAQLNPHFTRGAASNAYAIGKSGTANGAGMLLGNPHWPWFGSNQFFEIHMTVPGKYDVFGVINGDAPLPLIGFNKDVAWTHTVSPTLRQTLFELTLTGTEGTRYRVGNEERNMIAKQVAIEVKQADGSISTETRTLYSSHLGPIVSVNSLIPGGVNLRWTASTAYTLRDANLNSLRFLEQWMRIGQANSVAGIEKALREVVAIPYVHTIAADRNGNALYADIGPTPNLTRAKLQPASAGGCVKGATAQAVLQLANLPILDGSRAECDWAIDVTASAPGLMPVAKLPSIIRTDYVANSNQSAWLVNPLARIDDLEPIFGNSIAPLTLRQRLAFMQIEERMAGTDGISATPGFDSLETMQKMLFGNRLLAAELTIAGKSNATVRNDLVQECLPAAGQNSRIVSLSSGGDVDIAPACKLLQAWDGRANLDSRGAVLFREFWRRLRMPTGTPLWLTPFDSADPLHTPRDLNTLSGTSGGGDTLRHTLAETIIDLTSKGIDFARPLGELQGTTRGAKRIALHGGDEFEGTFNKITMRENNTSVPLTAAGYTDVFAGSSYIQAVTWVNGIVSAKGLLAYSQSSDPASPHFADQTEALYALKKFADLPFSEAEIAAQQVGPTERIVSP
jgi:acyl-homoserine-lactone acylase